MNYIRTKDGIYEVVDFDNESIIPSPIVKMDGRLTHILDYKDYKQADTIEELIDDVIIVDKTNYHYKVKNFDSISLKYVTSKRQWLNDYAFSFIEDDEFVYGAIWTGKGLIYVAKMNDKGKLVLI